MFDNGINIYMIKKIKCVYRIDVGNHFYIGSSTNYRRRIQSHFQKLKNNSHANPILQNLFNKGYELNFNILQEYDDVDTNIQDIEQNYLNIFFNDENCINICEKVGGGAVSRNPKEASKKAAQTKRENGYYDNKIIFSEEHKKNLSKAAKERTMKNLKETTNRIIAGREKRWREYNKNFILKDDNGNVYGPFKFIQDPQKQNILNRKSTRWLLEGKKKCISGFTAEYINPD